MMSPHLQLTIAQIYVPQSRQPDAREQIFTRRFLEYTFHKRNVEMTWCPKPRLYAQQPPLLQQKTQLQLRKASWMSKCWPFYPFFFIYANFGVLKLEAMV